jgi:DNA-binding MarR family transcriptional regulator
MLLSPETDEYPNAAMDAPGSARSDCLVELLAQAAELLTAAFSRELTRYGLPHREWRVLAALRDHDGQRMSDLAKHSLYKPSALTYAIDRMERSGLVERRSSPGERRAVRVFLTKHGQRTVAPPALHAARHDDALNLSLGESTVRKLKTMLSGLIDQLELGDEDGSGDTIAARP